MKYLSVLVPASSRAAAAAVIGSIWPTDPHPENNVGVPLLAADDAPWFGGNMALTAEEAEGLEALEGVENIRTYTWGISDRLLDASYPAGPTIGSAWGWSQCLADAGLRLPPVDL